MITSRSPEADVQGQVASPYRDMPNQSRPPAPKAPSPLQSAVIGGGISQYPVDPGLAQWRDGSRSKVISPTYGEHWSQGGGLQPLPAQSAPQAPQARSAPMPSQAPTSPIAAPAPVVTANPQQDLSSWIKQNYAVGYGNKPFDEAYWHDFVTNPGKANNDFEYAAKRLQGWQNYGADAPTQGPYAGQPGPAGKTPTGLSHALMTPTTSGANAQQTDPYYEQLLQMLLASDPQGQGMGQ